MYAKIQATMEYFNRLIHRQTKEFLEWIGCIERKCRRGHERRVREKEKIQKENRKNEISEKIVRDNGGFQFFGRISLKTKIERNTREYVENYEVDNYG